MTTVPSLSVPPVDGWMDAGTSGSFRCSSTQMGSPTICLTLLNENVPRINPNLWMTLRSDLHTPAARFVRDPGFTPL